MSNVGVVNIPSKVQVLPATTRDHQTGTGEMIALTDRQQDVLKAIRDHVGRRGYPPSRKELADTLGLSAPGSVEGHLNALVRKGWIELAYDTRRGIRLLNAGEVPLIEAAGEIAAGEPLVAECRIIDRMAGTCADRFTPRPDFFLKVRGTSLEDLGVQTGDLLAVKSSPVANPGDLVVARINGEITAKRFRRVDERHVELAPASPRHDPIVVDLVTEDFAIDGIVVGTLIGKPIA